MKVHFDSGVESLHSIVADNVVRPCGEEIDAHAAGFFPHVGGDVVEVIRGDISSRVAERLCPAVKIADTVGWRPCGVMRNAGALLARCHSIGCTIDHVITEAGNDARDGPHVAQQRKGSLELGALECRQPIAPLDFRVDKLAIRDSDEARHSGSELRHSGNERAPAPRLSEDDELTPHSHDLRAINVEIDVSVERGEARGVSQVRRHVNAHDRNRARECMHHDDGVTARIPIELFSVGRERMNRNDGVGL